MAEIIAEPTALSKVIPLKFKINDVDVPKTTQLSTNKQFNTTDTDAWFTFELDGLASTSGTYDLTLINLDDKSIFHHADVIFPALPFHYKLNSSDDVTLNEIRHAGRWLGQLVVTLSNGDTTGRQFGFNIAGHILDGQDAQVILLSDYQALINTINLAKDDLAQYNVDYAALIADVDAKEALREQAEIDRAATFDALVESEMVAQNVATKLAEKEATFAPRMLSLESELAEIATYAVDDIIADAGATYTGSGWTYTKGTDMSDIINSLIKTKNVVKLPKGNIYLTKPLMLRSGTVLEGQVSANGKYLTRFIFNGALGDDCIKVDSSFEVSHYKIRFLRISDVREQMQGQPVTGGYGIFANNAVNSQLIEDCFIDGFGHGAIHVGSNSTARAGDNIVINRCWVSMGKVTKRAIAVGNFNNTCSISNIYCDGDGIVVDRYLGNYLSGVLNLNNIKHEHNADTSSQTIKTANNDQVYASNIIRRFSVANPIGCVIKPVSNRGVYLNCSGQYNYDGTGKGTRNIFKNTDDTVASIQDNYMGRTTFGEFIELKSNLQIHSGAGTPEGVVTAKAGSLYFRTDGSIASAVYLKEQNSEGNTGWKELQGIRSGPTANRPTALGFTPPVGYQYFDTTLGKPIWFKTGTTWVDSTGATV